MRLLLIPLLISVLTACSQHSPATYTVAPEYIPNNSTGAFFVNRFKSAYRTLPEDAQAEHKSCTDFLLRNGNPGEQCKWQTYESIGIVKLVQIDAQQCHYFLNTMHYKGREKRFQQTACYSSVNESWIFR